MNRLYTFILPVIFTVATMNSMAQNGCGGGRYMSKIFNAYDLTSNVTYGQNYKLNGSAQTLLLDVYQPQGDDTTLLRPLIIWIHGGTFIGGDKAASDVKPLSEDFSKMGFVVASINYRIGMQDYPLPGPDSADATESVIRAVHDARAAVRYFKKDFSENGNTYKIDTNLIFVAGVSAGAITAIHLAYLDETSEFPTYVDTSKVGLGGGVEGNSGNPGYSSKVRAIINSAGAIRDTAWIKPGDTPILSLHGTNDGTVPYGSEMIYVSGFYPIMVVDGSASIGIRADNLGVQGCLKPFYGADHTPHVGNAAYTDTLEKYTTNFLNQFICGAPPACAYELVSVKEEASGENYSIYPNPSAGSVTIQYSRNTSIPEFSLFDITGRKILEEKLNGQNSNVNLHTVSSGIYFYQLVEGNEIIKKGKLVKE